LYLNHHSIGPLNLYLSRRKRR